MLTQEIATKALNRLGNLLAEKGQHFELMCAGGIVSLLYFKSRSQTADVDVRMPKGLNVILLKKAIDQVGAEMGLSHKDGESQWMNDSLSLFDVREKEDTVIFDHPNLKLVAVKWEEQLAMKVVKLHTDIDLADGVMIMKQINNKDKEDLFNSVVTHKPAVPTMPLEKMRQNFDVIWKAYTKLEERLIIRRKMC